MVLGWCLVGMVLVGLLVPASLVTVARLRDSSGLGWVALRAVTPLAVAPYALALLVLAAVWPRSQGAARAGLGALVVAVAAALVLHLSWAAPAFVGPTPAVAGGRTFRVMTVNLHLGEADVAAVLRAAAQARVTVLVVEEVTGPALSRLLAAGVRRDFPHAVGRPAEGRDGVMVFSAHRLVPVGTVASSTPGYAMDVRLDGRRIRLVAVHPISPNNGLGQWKIDLALARQAADQGRGPTMVVGDFNATTDHQPILDLLADGFADAATEARSGWQPTWPSGGQARAFGVALPPLVPLDHVFVSGDLNASWTRTVAVAGTDHRALVAQVSL